jgi:hypothetical protein
VESTAAKSTNERDNLTRFITFSSFAMDVEVEDGITLYKDALVARVLV